MASNSTKVQRPKEQKLYTIHEEALVAMENIPHVAENEYHMVFECAEETVDKAPVLHIPESSKREEDRHEGDYERLFESEGAEMLIGMDEESKKVEKKRLSVTKSRLKRKLKTVSAQVEIINAKTDIMNLNKKIKTLQDDLVYLHSIVQDAIENDIPVEQLDLSYMSGI